MSKRDPASLFRSGFFGDGDADERKAKEREAELAQQRREKREADRVCASVNGKFSHAAERRELRKVEEARRAELADPAGDALTETDVAAAQAMGLDLEALAKHKKLKRTEERKQAGLEPTGPGSHDRKPNPDNRVQHGHPGFSGRPVPALSRAGEHAVDTDTGEHLVHASVPDPTAPTRGLTAEAFKVAELAGVSPLALARHIYEKGAVRIAAGAVVDED